jgi:uncharacterized repeat protein (TIGR03806 family)
MIVENNVRHFVIVLVALALFAPGYAIAGDAVSANAVRKPYGLEHRTLWTTSKITGTPDPPDPYRTEIAFPKISFHEPLAMAVVPGTSRLAVAERPGKIYAFENSRESATKDLLLDVGRTVYGFAFHPQFATNGYIYVANILDAGNPSPTGSRLSRFHLAKNTIGSGAAKTETVLLEWPSGGHNGGCLAFGPDGYLYLATGDGSGIADQLETGQDVSDLLASILRIDVDHPADGKPYGIPKDNPFIGTSGARPEIWAYGLRQAWKFSFDSRSGDLWAGEVGQDLWESVLRIERGGNYGWSVNEATHPFRPQRKLGPTPILKPVVEHPHVEFRSVTGGYVYHGGELPELAGAYIYGDYDTGKIWCLRYQDGKVTDHRELADTQLRIVSFGEDAAGELLLIDFIGGVLHRLLRTPPATTTAPPFPRKLSETGRFTSTKDHQPAPGLIPYSVNAPLWSDGAEKQRYLALPGNSQIEFNAITYPQPAPGAQPGWRFPDDTVVVKTFTLEMEAGNPASTRRLETRILHFEQIPGTDEVGAEVWHGYTYVWNDEQTDAELLDTKGADRVFTIADKQAPGGKREQTWHFPSRAECTLCHTIPAKFALGVNTLQMNKDHDYGGVVANQLRTLEHLGIFKQPLPFSPEQLPRLVDYHDTKNDLNDRARSYLHANCAHCHTKWGGGNAEFQLLATLPLEKTGTIQTKPGQGSFGLDDPRILVPGSPERSMIYFRPSKLGLGRMPHVASSIVDREALELLSEWIKSLK